MSLQQYRQNLNAIMVEMIDYGLTEGIDIDSHSGRMLLLAKYIDRIRVEAEFVRKNAPLYDVDLIEAIDNYISKYITPLEEKNDKVMFVFSQFIITIAQSAVEIQSDVIAFFIPMLIDCWDEKI